MFPKVNARWKYDYFEGEQIFISPFMQGKWMFYSTSPNVLVNSANWNLLAIFVYKIIISEISGVIFTNMEYRYMTKALNLENFE